MPANQQLSTRLSRIRRGAAHKDLGAALGASCSFPVENKPHGPFGVAALVDEIQNRLVGWIETKLESWMGLEVNREKTRVIKLRQKGASLDFLGYTFRYDRARPEWGQHRYLNVVPSKKALARERAKLRELTSAQRNGVPIPQVIGELNRHLKSWANYFRYGYPQRAFGQINS